MNTKSRWALIGLLAVGLVGCGAKDEPEAPGEADGNGGGGQQAAAASGVALSLDDRMFAAAVIHPKRLTESDAFAALPDDLDLDLVQRDLGFDVRHAERVVVGWYAPNAEQLEKGTTGGGVETGESVDLDGKTDEEIEAYFLEQDLAAMNQPLMAGEWVFVITFDEPIDRANYLGDLETQPIKVGDHDGHLVWAREAIVFADDGKTLLNGPVPALEAMLDDEPATGSLAKRVTAAGEDFDALLVVDLAGQERFKEIAKGEVDGSGLELPGALQKAPDAAMKIAAITATADVGDDHLAGIIIDGEDAKQIGAAAEAALGLLRQSFDSLFPLPPDAGPELKKADELLKGVLAGIKTSVHSDQVLVTIPHPGGKPEGTIGYVENIGPELLRAQDRLRRYALLSAFKSKLKDVGVAMHNYHDLMGHFPAAVAFARGDDQPLLSWRVAILPQLEAAGLYEELRLDEPWDSEHNKPLLERMPAVYESPGVTEPGMTTLMVFTGPNTPNPKIGPAVNEGDPLRRGLQIRDYTDGLSNTILAVYAAPEKAVPWTKPTDLVIDPENPLACFGEIPEEGVQVLYCDGSVRMLPPDIAADPFEKLVQHNDGNIVPRF